MALWRNIGTVQQGGAPALIFPTLCRRLKPMRRAASLESDAINDAMAQ